MKILAFAASNSKNSINHQLAKYTANLHQDATVEILYIDDYELPIFSTSREEQLGQPALAKQFFNKIGNADALIISFAEHNGSYTAAYKNLFDWVSRIDHKVFQDKPTILLSTSPGPGGASSVLASATQSAPFFAADVKASISVPSFFDNFNVEDGLITNSEISTELKQAVQRLVG